MISKIRLIEEGSMAPRHGGAQGGVKPPSPAQRGLRSGTPQSEAGCARKCPNSRATLAAIGVNLPG